MRWFELPRPNATKKSKSAMRPQASQPVSQSVSHTLILTNSIHSASPSLRSNTLCIVCTVTHCQPGRCMSACLSTGESEREARTDRARESVSSKNSGVPAALRCLSSSACPCWFGGTQEKPSKILVPHTQQEIEQPIKLAEQEFNRELASHQLLPPRNGPSFRHTVRSSYGGKTVSFVCKLVFHR